jgi:peroxiredoxin Q/BCP
MLQIGDTLPNIDLLLTGGKQTQLSAYLGKPLVLFFYPKASTPGCTQEGLDFTAAQAEFTEQGCAILGASRDGLKAQENFKNKQGFTFDLIADKDETLCQAMGVIVLKKLYGKESLGIERSTFLFNADGQLEQVWRKVKVPGHVDEVLAAVKTL